MNKKQRKKVKKSSVTGKGKKATIKNALQGTLKSVDVLIEAYEDRFKVCPGVKGDLGPSHHHFVHMREDIVLLLKIEEY